MWPTTCARWRRVSIATSTQERASATKRPMGVASAWRRGRRLSLGGPSLTSRCAGRERGGDADMADGEKSPDADEGRATDSQR